MRNCFATESRGQETGEAAATDPGSSQGLLHDRSGCLLRKTSVWQYLESQGAIVVDNGRFGRHDSQVTAAVQQSSFSPVSSAPQKAKYTIRSDSVCLILPIAAAVVKAKAHPLCERLDSIRMTAGQNR